MQESAQFVSFIPSFEDRMNYVYEYYDFDDDYVSYGMSTNSEFKENVSHYIVGYVVRKVSAKLECDLCISDIREKKSPGLISTLDIKSYMTYPSRFAKKIAEICECVLTVELNKDFMKKKYFFDYLMVKTSNIFVANHGALIKELHDHAFNLMKMIIESYIMIRLKSHARLENDKLKQNRIRNKLNKIVLFSHQ